MVLYGRKLTTTTPLASGDQLLVSNVRKTILFAINFQFILERGYDRNIGIQFGSNLAGLSFKKSKKS